MSVPDYVRLARHELDLDDDGHEDILTSVTTETDDTLVLAPDGLGGVEFRAETGGGSSFATPAIVLGTAAAAGAASTVIRSDSTIVAFDATAPTTSAIGDSAATGSTAKAARRDHVHGREALSTATPLVESGAGAIGTGIKSSREDHVHPAASSGATITTKDEGSTLSSTVTTLDFVGAGVTASGGGATTTVTIPGSAAGSTPPTFVQFKTSGTSNTALTLTMDAAPTSGNVIVLGSFSNGNAGLTSVTQTNVAWTKMVTGTAITATKAELWIGKVSGSAGTLITIVRAGGNAVWSVIEVSGVTVTPTLGQNAEAATNPLLRVPITMATTTAGHFVACFTAGTSQNIGSTMAASIQLTGIPMAMAATACGYSLGSPITIGAFTSDGAGGAVIIAEIT